MQKVPAGAPGPAWFMQQQQQQGQQPQQQQQQPQQLHVQQQQPGMMGQGTDMNQVRENP